MLSKIELSLVGRAQDLARRKKARSQIIHCPFYFMGDERACRLCHKWMGTDNRRIIHPCEDLDSYEIRERFWRKPNGNML